VRISVSEWLALKLAIRLPRALVDPRLLAPFVRRHAFTRRGIAAIACVLLAVLVLLHVQGSDSGVRRLIDLTAQLAGVKSIEARWDAAVAHARTGASTTPGAVHDSDVARIQRPLDLAVSYAASEALRTAAAELKKAYVEKADVVARFERASIDSRAALTAAVRSDAAITAAVREAWRDFPQRERLVAAENLVLRVLSAAQQYHDAPSAVNRAIVEAHAADLSRPHALPKPIQSGLARLEADVHRLLLLAPLEQMLSERLRALDTARRLDELADVFERELAESIVRRERYRAVLIAYTIALLLLIAWLVVRAIARFHDLEVLYTRQTRQLAKTLRRLSAYERPARETRAAPGEEDARVVNEERRTL